MTKIEKGLSLIIIATVFCSGGLNAQEKNQKEEYSPLSFSITTDAVYYPKSEAKVGRDDVHFAEITGAYSGFECRSTISADYKIPTPLGEHWLLKDANFVFTGALELTPLSVKPQLSLSFSPFPFLLLKGGASIGLGWNYLGLEGIAKLNKDTGEYETISTLSHPFYELWAQGTLMFDTGAVFPGKWNHVVTLASFRTFYSGIAGLEEYTPYEWQNDKNRVAGLQYEFNGILAYQMPLAFYRAGLMYTIYGHFDGSDYGDFDESYDGAFAQHSIAAVFQFRLSARDELTCIPQFTSRRSFEKEISEAEEALYTKKTGREWYFQRLIFSWTHNFQ